MELDCYDQKRKEMAVLIIQEWKNAREELERKFGSFAEFAIQREAEEMWKDSEVRAEFGHDFSVLISYLQNEHIFQAHGGGVKTYKQEDFKDANSA